MKEREPQAEAQEIERGNNVTIDIQLARHGKKASFNAARIENPQEVKELASEFDLSGYDYVGVRTTPVERAVDTARSIKEGFQSNPTVAQDALGIRVRQLSSGILSEGGTMLEEILKDTEESKDINLISPVIKEKYKEAVLAAPDSDWDKENAGVNLFVEMMGSELQKIPTAMKEMTQEQEFSNEAKKELEVFKQEQLASGGISILEVALRMSKHLDKYVQLTQRLDSDSKVFLYEVNHSGFIEPDLIYLIRNQIEQNPVDPKGGTILEKMGGAFQPSEGVKISIKRDRYDAPAAVVFDLRGKQYIIEVDGQSDILTKSQKLLNEVAISEEVLAKKHEKN